MKLGALDHPKTIDFAASLGVCLPQAIGHLELLWAFVGHKTPRGNIGRWSNAVIAYNAQWIGNPDTFVDALVSAGFVDEDDEHRLLVHDWKDHLPRWVKAKLAREKKAVIVRDCTEEHSADNSENDSRDCSADYSSDSVSEGKGSEGKGSKNHLSDADAPDADFEALWAEKPARPNQSKQRTLKAYRARLREGVSHTEMFDALRRYNACMDAEDRPPDKRFHLATFIGPDRHFECDWEVLGKVPTDIDELRTLVHERHIKLPENCSPKQARIEISRQTGMRL